MSKMRDQLIVQPLEGHYFPALAGALWRLQDARERTMRALQDLAPEEIDWRGHGLDNTIGTLLYHIAAIEIDWLYAEILQRDWPQPIEALLTFPVRDGAGRLYPVGGVTLEQHLARLQSIRVEFLTTLSGYTETEYQRVRQMPNYDVTPAWVLHHLAQHEAEHRGEILTIRTLFRAAHSSGMLRES